MTLREEIMKILDGCCGCQVQDAILTAVRNRILELHTMTHRELLSMDGEFEEIVVLDCAAVLEVLI